MPPFHVPEPAPQREERGSYLCAACWRRFPVAELHVVAECTGMGFRCRECYEKRGNVKPREVW